MNPLTKPTQVTIDEKTYDLVMTYAVYLEAERITGISTITDDDQYFAKPSRTTLPAMLYALLKEAGADFTLPQVQRMITGRNLKAVYQTVLTCHALAQAEAENSGPLVTTPDE